MGKDDSDGGSVDIDFRDCGLYADYTLIDGGSVEVDFEEDAL